MLDLLDCYVKTLPKEQNPYIMKMYDEKLSSVKFMGS